MTALSTTPSNTNFLSPLGFRFQIKKAPNVTFYVQAASLPSLALGTTQVPTPFVKQPIIGDHVEYGDLTITFKLDEDMHSYLEIYNWMIGIGFPDNFDQYRQISQKEVGEGIYSDLTLTVLSSAMNPNFEVQFLDAYPVSLTEINFDSRLSDVEYIEVTTTFKYRKYTITKL